MIQKLILYLNNNGIPYKVQVNSQNQFVIDFLSYEIIEEDDGFCIAATNIMNFQYMSLDEIKEWITVEFAISNAAHDALLNVRKNELQCLANKNKMTCKYCKFSVVPNPKTSTWLDSDFKEIHDNIVRYECHNKKWSTPSLAKYADNFCSEFDFRQEDIDNLS